jgi:hypothetical protein
MKKIIALTAVLATCLTTTALGAAARNTSGTIYAHTTHVVGKDLYVSGDVKDKLLGQGAIVYITNPSQNPDGSFLVKARKITIYLPNGTLSGVGQATQTIAGDSVTVSNGTFSLTKGTGKYKGRTLKGTFSGTQDKAMVYKFTYKGKLS